MIAVLVAAAGALATLAALAAAAPTRSLWLTRSGNILHVRATGVEFIAGAPLARLRDGRSVRVEFEASVAPAPNGPFVTHARQRFVLSYDLWEERFAATRLDPPPRTISHLVARDTEAWCLDQLDLPASAFSQFTARAPFWIRLTYRLEDEDQTTAKQGDEGITLHGLIDRLSRRRAADTWTDSIVSGPLRIE